MTKLRIWDRILAALMGILCIAAAAAIGLYAFGLLPLQQLGELIGKVGAMDWRKWLIYGGAVAVLLIIGFYGVGMLFRRRKDKGFVVQHTDFGEMSISMKAMENMVKKCVDAHDELTVNQTKIYLVRNGVSVDMKITLASGVNIPLTVNALQKQIKQYITSCSGVDVYDVRVKVETDNNVKLLPAPQTPVVEPEPVEEVKCVEAPAGRDYQYHDEPEVYTEAPAKPEPEVPAEEPVVEQTEEPRVEETEIQPETEEVKAEETEAPAEEANA